MPKSAMNLTYGDFIILEFALVLYVKDIDLSLQAGQYISELIGKIEYHMQEMRKAAETQLPAGLMPGAEKTT